MAQLDALSIYLTDGTTLDDLFVLQNQMIENIQKRAVSVFLKNKNLSGNPRAGSVEVKRFANSAVQAYGTAAAAGAGNAIRDEMVTILLDQYYEIAEDVEKADLDQYGIVGMIEKRRKNFEMSVIRHLDTAFFAEAYAEGTVVSVTGTSTREDLEELIVALETVANTWVDGVDREDIALVLSIETRSALRDEIDELPVAHIATDAGAIGMWHGVVVFDSNRLPKATGQTVDAMVMYMGAVAQPVLFEDFYVERIPRTQLFSIELFFKYGIEAVMPDLIMYTGDQYVAGS